LFSLRALALTLTSMSVWLLPAAAYAQAPAPSASGGAQYPPPPPPQVDMSTPGAVAKLLPDGTAAAPADAPPQVQSAIWAANHIQDKPYRYGGGHRSFVDTAYDCSGTVSFALHGGGLLKAPLASGGLMTWGRAHRGRWITVYANAGHAYMVIAGLRLDTSGTGGSGPRWQTLQRDPAGFVPRHPKGL
jgi:cell wall-associated NlpC family hydrolase